MGNALRVALYARVSTEEQKRRGLSLPEQEHVLEEYAKANKMKVVGKYLDGGKSARKRYTSRPEFMRLLDDIQADKIDMVLFIKLDRWFRSISDYYEVQRILDAHNVKWKATQEDYETVTASGRFKVNIMLSVAQDEADRTSERIKFVFQGKRERNEPVCGKVPKGYKIEGKQVALDEKTAPIVRRAFDMYLETGSPSKVIKAFPELNLSYLTTKSMFTSAAYMGEFSGIKIPPIITKDEHDMILSMQGHVVRKAKQNRTYLFSGLISCPECGSRMGARYYHKNKSCKEYYVCPKHSQRRGCGFKTIVREDRIEEYLLTHIDSEIQIIMESKEKQESVSYKLQRDAVKRKLTKLSELYLNDLIAMDDYKWQYEELTSELAAIPEDVKPVNIQALKERFFPDWQSIYSELPKAEKQAFWRKSIESIAISESGAVSGFVLRKFTT